MLICSQAAAHVNSYVTCFRTSNNSEDSFRMTNKLRDWTYKHRPDHMITEMWPAASAAMGAEQSGLCRWLPASVIHTPTSNSGPTEEMQISPSKPITRDAPASSQLPWANNLQVGHTWSLFFFLCKTFPLAFESPRVLEPLTNANDGGGLPFYRRLWINSFCLFSCRWSSVFFRRTFTAKAIYY